MADILRVPIATTHYRNDKNRQNVSGGFSTMFLEMPYNYVLGGYEYTKTTLAPVINGYWGVHSDIHYPSFQTDPKPQYYGDMRNAGMLHAGLLGYYGGYRQEVNHLGSFNTATNTYRLSHSCGTIGRRARAMPYIRDNAQTNIIYMLMSGPNRNEFATIAKIDTSTRETVWRQIMDEDEPISYTETNTAVGGSNNGYVNYTPYQIDGRDVNIAPAALSVTAQEIEYLYQDADNLYFLMGGPRHRRGGYVPTAVYIYSVSKDTGEVSESDFINIYTLGIVGSSPDSRIGYKFLGFIDQTRFLIDIQQTTGYDGYTYSGTSYNNYRIYRTLVLYDTNDNSAEALWVSDPLMMPFSAISGTQSYLGTYPITSTLIIDGLSNSIFMPLHWDVAYSMHAEAIVQLHLNAACDKVLSAEVLDGYNAWGMRNVLYADVPNVYGLGYSSNVYSNGPVYNYPNYWGKRMSYTYGKQVYPTDDAHREGMSFAITDYYNTDYMTAYRSLSRKSYDYLTTEREQPVLRLHAAMLYSTPKKTILPAGEDIIGQGSFSSNYNGTTVVQPWMRSKDPIVIANPWGVLVSHEGFTRAGSYAGVNGSYLYNAPGHYYNLTPNNQGAWSTYNFYTYSSYNYPGQQYTGQYYRGYMNYIGTLPDCSFTFRRSAPDLKNCCIYWNNSRLPIKAVSYSINPDPYYPSYAPTAWIVEAEDVDTGNWIVVDEQENQSLAFPPGSTGGQYAVSMITSQYRGTTDVDTRQYRNYYMLPDFKTKCPHGAHAIRITFKDSADKTQDGIKRVAVYGLMVQEEPWEWQPVLPTESIACVNTTLNFGDGACCFAGIVSNGSNTLPVFGSGTYQHDKGIRVNEASTVASGYPLGFQLAGPRTAAAMPGYYGTHVHRNQTDLPGNFWGWSQGVVIYSSDSSGWRYGVRPYYGYVFSSALEVQGFQLTISGTRHSADTQGGVVPSAIVIQGSVDSANWEDIVTIDDPNMMPGLQNDYVTALRENEDNNQPYCMYCKTFINTLENPVSYKYYRVTWPDDAGSVGSTPANTRRSWYINSFTFLKKRDPDYAKDAVAMQSVVDNEYVHHWANGNNYTFQTDDYLQPEMKGNPELVGYNKNQTPGYKTGYWNPWVTYQDTSHGRVWGGFDCFKNMHIGYSAHGYVMYRGTLDPNTRYYDPRYLRGFIICESGTLDGTNSVSVMASWQGMLQRTTTYQHKDEVPYGASASMIPGPDESLFYKPVYSDRIKVMAYVFVRSNLMGTNAGRPTHWKFWGSVDGQQWDLLDEQTKTDWKTTDVRNEFKIDDPDWYVYYKVEFLDSTDGGVWLMSIDTLIAGVKESDPYVHTRYPRNPVNTTAPVSIVSGELVKGSLGTVVNSRGFNAPAHLTYGSDDTSTFIIDQGEPWVAYGIYLKLNPTMEPTEYPAHVTISGSNDGSSWTEVLDDDALTWVLDPQNMRQPLSKHLDFDSPGKYRYVKVVFEKPSVTGKITEHWLQRTFCDGRFLTANKHQELFKIFPDSYIAHADTYMGAPLANLWLTDDSAAQVEYESIKIRKLDPVSQQFKVVREIRPDGGAGCILGTVLDSGKNIWYWYNTGDAYEATGDARDTVDGIHGYAVLAAQSSYTPKTVHVKFENSTVSYEGETLTLKLLTWIEDPMAETDDKRVAGKVRLTLSGGNAQFVDNNEATLEVEVDAGQYTEVEFTADGPDRVHVQAFMMN